MIPLNEALELAERLEKDDCLGSTAQALRAVYRAYNELLSEYHAFEMSVEKDGGWDYPIQPK